MSDRSDAFPSSRSDLVLFPGLSRLFWGRPRSSWPWKKPCCATRTSSSCPEGDARGRPSAEDLYQWEPLSCVQMVRRSRRTTKALVEGITRVGVDRYSLERDISMRRSAG